MFMGLLLAVVFASVLGGLRSQHSVASQAGPLSSSIAVNPGSIPVSAAWRLLFVIKCTRIPTCAEHA